MEKLQWTLTQVKRFKELGINPDNIETDFSTSEQRNAAFQEIEKKQVKNMKAGLIKFLNNSGKSKLDELADELTKALNQQGFAKVSTPIIISRSFLAKMGIDQTHPLFKQVFWTSEKQCLRPMLAPNLYSLMTDLGRLNHWPVRFFEIGSCFRKESDGSKHKSEFTMLNLVEMGLQEPDSYDRLRHLASIIAKTAGLDDYTFTTETSGVYGTTLDVVAGPENIEVASGAVGPHPLDAAWNITTAWAGIGFGLERLLMASHKDRSIRKWGKSLSYLNGIRLNI